MGSLDIKKTMSEYADLELGLYRREASSTAGVYSVEFRFSQPNSETDVRLGGDEPARVAFDLAALDELSDDPEAYGRQLTAFLFAEPAVGSVFAQARAIAEAQGGPLRLRLTVGPGAPELHRLAWETLRDPRDGSLLAVSENVLFSRYLSSQDWRPIQLRARGELRALFMAANPNDLSTYRLAPIDTPGELRRAREGLGPIPVVALSEPGDGTHATLNALTACLREAEFDILYLVCHGALVAGEPWLWLEDDEGKTARVSGAELAARLKELTSRPRLVVLASCESAGTGIGPALAALGPRLAEAGIPAVLAMQGKISLRTLAEFMPVFFRELQRDGQIDRAAAAARGAVRHHPDGWMPVLFLRLKSGRVWYIPGFGDGEGEFEKWQSLAGFVQEKTCTPILGPGFSDALLGSRRETAMRWAEKHGFPLAPQDRDVLPRVAQYVITHQSPAYLPVALREALRDELLRRYGETLPPELLERKVWSSSDLSQALDLVMAHSLQRDTNHPYRLLAQLRLPIYITTGPLGLLERALIQAGAEPVVRVCPWNRWVPADKAIYEDTPTPEKPLLYHLFGHISVPNSLVYAEDRYFDYLIGVTLNKSLIPSSVRAALTSTSLLFLGFQMEDWEFRVFFRFLMAQEGRELLKFYSHAAAQIEPDEDRILDIQRARRYLEEYFEGENIGIYWGSSEEFLKNLHRHL